MVKSETNLVANETKVVLRKGPASTAQLESFAVRGERIKSGRVALDLTLRQFALLIGVQHGRLSEIEQGICTSEFLYQCAEDGLDLAAKKFLAAAAAILTGDKRRFA